MAIINPPIKIPKPLIKIIKTHWSKSQNHQTKKKDSNGDWWELQRSAWTAVSEVIGGGTVVARLKRAAEIGGGKESVRWESNQREKERRWREKKKVKYEIQSYNNRTYMHDYCSIFPFIQTYASTDVSGFLVKMCKTKHFLYFVNFCNHWYSCSPFLLPCVCF